MRDALHVPLHEWTSSSTSCPPASVDLLRSGFPARIAASILQRPGHPVVHVDDDLARVAELKLPLRGSVAA